MLSFKSVDKFLRVILCSHTYNIILLYFYDISLLNDLQTI